MPGYLVVPTIGFCALFLVSHAFWLMNSSSQIECAWSGVVAKKDYWKTHDATGFCWYRLDFCKYAQWANMEKKIVILEQCIVFVCLKG